MISSYFGRQILDVRFDAWLERPDRMEDSAWDAVVKPVQRIHSGLLGDDLELVIGSSKELVESIARNVLSARGQTVADNVEFHALIKAAHVELDRQPGQGLAAEAPARDIAQALKSAVNQLPVLRNRYGTGHGRALSPDVCEELASVSVDAALLWSRWALRRLEHVLAGAPVGLIYDLEYDIFTAGDITDRLVAARLSDLEPHVQQQLGVAVAQRAMRGTFLAQGEGVAACAESRDTVQWPNGYRVGLIRGLLIDRNGHLNTDSWAIGQIELLLPSISDSESIFSDVVQSCYSASYSRELDPPSDTHTSALREASKASKRAGAKPFAETWKRLVERLDCPF